VDCSPPRRPPPSEYVAFQGPPPDLPGSPDGLVPPGYLKYPLNPVKSVQQPVGDGQEVTAVTYTTQAPPTAAEQNPAWQRVDQETGFSIKLPLTQLADYPTRLNTTIAGGALPDLLSLGTGNGLGIAGLPAFLQSQCMDLTPLISGDAIKQFPNLANLPPYAWRNAVFNNFSMRGVAPFPANPSSKPVHHLGPGANLLTVLKKTSTDRATKLLGLLNYVSAPFGTQEYLTMWYGVEGAEFEFDQNHNPVVSPTGQTDLFIPWPNVGAAPTVLYDASSADYARVMSRDVAVIEGMGIQNPVVGLYSPTKAQRAASLNQTMGDGLLAIIFGRSDMSSFDPLVTDWRSQGGDQIRSEFEQALASSKP